MTVGIMITYETMIISGTFVCVSITITFILVNFHFDARPCPRAWRHKLLCQTIPYMPSVCACERACQSIFAKCVCPCTSQARWAAATCIQRQSCGQLGAKPCAQQRNTGHIVKRRCSVGAHLEQGDENSMRSFAYFDEACHTCVHSHSKFSIPEPACKKNGERFQDEDQVQEHSQSKHTRTWIIEACICAWSFSHPCTFMQQVWAHQNLHPFFRYDAPKTVWMEA